MGVKARTLVDENKTSEVEMPIMMLRARQEDACVVLVNRNPRH